MGASLPRGDRSVTRRLSEFDTAVRLLRGAFLLDHSVSVSELGSLFQRDGEGPLVELKRSIAKAYGVAWSFPAACGTSPLNVLGLVNCTQVPAGTAGCPS